jgi:hypothetical protein
MSGTTPKFFKILRNIGMTLAANNEKARPFAAWLFLFIVFFN